MNKKIVKNDINVLQLKKAQQDLLWAAKRALKRLKLSNDSIDDQMVINLLESSIDNFENLQSKS